MPIKKNDGRGRQCPLRNLVSWGKFRINELRLLGERKTGRTAIHY